MAIRLSNYSRPSYTVDDFESSVAINEDRFPNRTAWYWMKLNDLIVTSLLNTSTVIIFLIF